MELDQAGQEVIKEFRSSLADLVVNSRPLIQMLTMLADENKSIAAAIVDAIEKQLIQASSSSKLPVFYLIDSICKNVKKVYIDLFMTNLVTNFCNVFEAVDEKTRACLFKLRNSWSDIFPATKLYALDARVQLLDPAWPIASMPVSKASSIHVNPRFLKGAAAVAPSAAKDPKKLEVLQKKQELLELQEKKVALELLQARASVHKTAPIAAIAGINSASVPNSKVSTDAAVRKNISRILPVLSHQSILLKANASTNRTVIRPSTMIAARPPPPLVPAAVPDFQVPPSKDPRLERAAAKARLEKVASPDVIVIAEAKKDSSKSKKESPSKKDRVSSSKKSSSSSSSSKVRSSSSSSKSKKESSKKKPAVPDGKFKEIKSIHLRNYMRKSHNRSISSSPEPPSESSKVEQKKSDQDVDLRRLGSPTGKKRGSTPEKGASEQASSPKRSKQAEMLDELFGNEDVDLRQMSAPVRAEMKRAPDWARFKETVPDSYRSPLKNCNWENGSDISLSDIEIAPPPPPPKIIIPEELKISPASVAAAAAAAANNRRSGEFDSLGRPLLHTMLSEECKVRHRSSSFSEDVDLRALLAETSDDGQDNSEKISLMIAQADEQLNNGTLNMTEYKTLLKQVVQINEANKLKEAQRRDEQENWHESSAVWQDEDSRDSGKASPNDDQSAKEGGERRSRKRDGDPRGHDVDERYLHRRDFQHHRGGRGFNRGGRWNNNMGWDNWGPSRMSFNRGGHPRAPFQRAPGDFGGPRFWGNQGQFPGGPPFPPMHQGIRPMGNRSDLPPPDPRELEAARANFPRTIAIDGLNRDVRYYGDETIIFMSYDDPRDISFYPTDRTIEFENGFKVTMTICSGPKDVMIRGSMHRIKLGVPTRELNIDGKDYECYYGGTPVQVDLSGIPIRVQLEGPPPRVKISDYRRLDYCAGKITMTIDAVARIPVFLDATPQVFHIDGVPHTLRFIDALKRVLINGQPFVFDYGGLPQPIFVRGVRHYVGFSGLPQGITPGYITIQNMEGTRLPTPPREEPPLIPEIAVPEEYPGHSPALPMMGAAKDKKGAPQKTSSAPEPRKTPLSRSILNTKPQLDVITNLIPAAPATSTNGYNYQLHKEKEADNAAVSAPAVAPDLAELLAKLNEYGILQSVNAAEAKKKEEAEKKEEYKPVTLNPESLKMRQAGAYAGLYCGIQCSTCGLRFPPEQTLRYSQHLDWHFRQNRREKDSAKKAQSRKWYYDVSDWIQFEEIEDLEERAQSWFETQAEEDKVEEGEAEIPSVPAKDSEAQEQCEVCHEAFETFFLQEKEEWHLRDAIRVEDKVFHPHCYQDLQNTMDNTAESTDLNDTNADEEMKEETEEKKETTEATEEEPEAAKEEPTEAATEEPMEEGKEEETQPEKEKEDEAPEEAKEAEETETAEVKIKEEPMDSEPMEAETSGKIESKDSGIFSQEEQVVVKTEPIEEEQEPEMSVAEVDTTKMEVKSSIDGNVELQEAPAKVAGPAGKIKITITTPAPAIVEAKKEVEEEPETPSIEEPQRLPVKDQDFELKPRLRGRKLTEMPPVMKGREDSALCSIM